MAFLRFLFCFPVVWCLLKAFKGTVLAFPEFLIV